MRFHPTARLAVVSLQVLLAACGGSLPPPLTDVSDSWSETGIASWYGPGFHGKRTASGEVYDMDDLTAAHKRLPFGTVVLVENLDNGRRTEVRINDRGPFVHNRVIDLSRGAARAIGMLGPGTARVRLSVAKMSNMLGCSLVQVGAFSDLDNAGELERRLRKKGEPVIARRRSDGLTRVYLGPYGDLATAGRARDRYDGILLPCEDGD
jgi:rare lipoprotein A